MRIVGFETFLANAGLRNYLFIRLRTDTGLTGIGEATLEWQERTVLTVAHEWVEGRVVGRDPFDIEAVIGGMIRDQYQGGSTVMTAISGVEIALWDIIGKATNQPVYRLIGGRCRANPGLCQRLVRRRSHALRLCRAGQVGRLARLSRDEVRSLRDRLEDPVAGGSGCGGRRRGRGPRGRRPRRGPDDRVPRSTGAGTAIDMIRRLERFRPEWCEEPVVPESLELLAEVKRSAGCPIAAGERLYTQSDFYRLTALRAADIIQMDLAHCGGILAGKKVAAMAAPQDMLVAPHCSIGPVALAACLHFDASTPNFLIQEAFAEFDVPWRNDLVAGWNPIKDGEFFLSDSPGLGLELDERAIADHPYVPNAFPSLWDGDWQTNFTQDR